MKLDAIQIVTVDGSLDEFECPLSEERLKAAVEGKSFFSSHEDRELAAWALKVKGIVVRAKQ